MSGGVERERLEHQQEAVESILNECAEDVVGEGSAEDDSLSDGSAIFNNKYQIPQKLTGYSFKQTEILASEGSTASKIPDEHSSQSVLNCPPRLN